MSKFLLPGKLQRSGAVEPFPSGTLMLFQQTAAPTGWTKQTTHDDKSLRVVSGTAGDGGNTAFGTVFGAGKTTGNASPGFTNHAHTVGTSANAAGVGTALEAITPDFSFSSGSAGTGSSHNHTLSLDLQFVDVTIARKD